MNIIDKSYTIRYSKGGISQFADFNYSKDKFIRHSFRPSWVKEEEIPILEGLTDINDFLKVIKEWSYGKQAEIIAINGNHPNYTSKDMVNYYANEFEDYFNSFCLKFFKSEILPIIKKNKWKFSYSGWGRLILIKKKNKEWNNVEINHKDSILIDNICNKFVNKVLQLDIEWSLKREYGYISGDSFNLFFKWINELDLINLKIFVKL